MTIRPSPIPGVMVVETAAYTDHRGAFARLFCQKSLKEVVGARPIVQINHSRTHMVGAVRGLHFQRAPHAEMKLVRCLKGKVWDVAVDLRAGSSTFMRWHAVELSVANARMLVIPEGCAHGFQVLEADSELLYLHTAFYEPDAEGGIRHNDPRVAIPWPLLVADMSDRDVHQPLIPVDFSGLTV